jgi:hypothetical protein
MPRVMCTARLQGCSEQQQLHSGLTWIVTGLFKSCLLLAARRLAAIDLLQADCQCMSQYQQTCVVQSPSSLAPPIRQVLHSHNGYALPDTLLSDTSSPLGWLGLSAASRPWLGDRRPAAVGTWVCQCRWESAARAAPHPNKNKCKTSSRRVLERDDRHYTALKESETLDSEECLAALLQSSICLRQGRVGVNSTRAIRRRCCRALCLPLASFRTAASQAPLALIPVEIPLAASPPGQGVSSSQHQAIVSRHNKFDCSSIDRHIKLHEVKMINLGPLVTSLIQSPLNSIFLLTFFGASIVAGILGALPWASRVALHVPSSKGHSSQVARLVGAVPLLCTFRTSCWLACAGGRITTIAVNACRRRRPQSYESIVPDVHLPHGGLIRLRWCLQPAGAACTLLVVPGTRGTEYSSYVEEVVSAARRRGWDVVVAPLRGCSEASIRTPHCLDGQHWTDLTPVVAAIRAARPGTRLCAVGYSMGGGMLSHYVAATGDACGVDCAVAISAAADYSIITDHMRGLWFGWFFEHALLYKLQAALREHVHLYDDVPGVSVERALKARSLAEWHNAVTCP